MNKLETSTAWRTVHPVLALLLSLVAFGYGYNPHYTLVAAESFSDFTGLPLLEQCEADHFIEEPFRDGSSFVLSSYCFDNGGLQGLQLPPILDRAFERLPEHFPDFHAEVTHEAGWHATRDTTPTEYSRAELLNSWGDYLHHQDSIYFFVVVRGEVVRLTIGYYNTHPLR